MLGVVLDVARGDRWKVALASEDGTARIVTCRPETLMPETSSLYGHPPTPIEQNESSDDESMDGGIEAAPPAEHGAPITSDATPATGTVLCFWGDARWSRTQLLGEIARGHWGMCRARARRPRGAGPATERARGPAGLRSCHGDDGGEHRARADADAAAARAGPFGGPGRRGRRRGRGVAAARVGRVERAAAAAFADGPLA